MAIREIQDNFTGGMTNDPYRANRDQFSRSKNIDIYSQVGRVRTYRGIDDISSGQTDSFRILFASDGKQYALSENALYMRNGTSWTNIQNTTGGDNVDMMFFEHQGFLYWWKEETSSGGYIVGAIDRYDIYNNVYTAGWDSVTLGTPTNYDKQSIGFRHPLEDRAFFAAGNEIYSISFNTDYLTLSWQCPDEYKIVSMTYWDKYLVIGVKSKAEKTDKVYFWDMISFTASFVREVPEGNLEFVVNNGTELVVLSTQDDVDGKMSLYTFTGGQFDEKVSIIVRNMTGDIDFDEWAKDIRNNTVYFGGTFNDYTGIWRFGLNKYNRYYITMDRSATDAGNEQYIHDINISEDTFYVIHHVGDITRTENAPNYTLTPTEVYLETIRFYAGEKHLLKKWLSVGLSTIEPIDETYTPANRSIKLLYRTDKQLAWTEIGVYDVSLSEFQEFTFENTEVTIEDYHYIEFRLEFTGLVQLSELYVRHSIKPQIYA